MKKRIDFSDVLLLISALAILLSALLEAFGIMK